MNNRIRSSEKEYNICALGEFTIVSELSELHALVANNHNCYFGPSYTYSYTHPLRSIQVFVFLHTRYFSLINSNIQALSLLFTPSYTCSHTLTSSFIRSHIHSRMPTHSLLCFTHSSNSFSLTHIPICPLTHPFVHFLTNSQVSHSFTLTYSHLDI
jgi:hypothetical protein